MVVLRNLVLAAVAGLSTQALALSRADKCGFTGCLYEPNLAAIQHPIATSASISDKIVRLHNVLATKSQALQAPAGSITIVNGPLIIAGMGPFPEIIRGFVDIISSATSGLAELEGAKPITDKAEADQIHDAFREFVRIHQALLSILIGRASLFTTVPFVGAPVAAVLRQIEAVVDTLSFTLIDMIESKATDIETLATSVGATLTTAINAYSGVLMD